MATPFIRYSFNYVPCCFSFIVRFKYQVIIIFPFRCLYGGL